MDARHTQVEPLAFTIVPKPVFDYVEAGKISDRAAWLYAVLLGYHNRTRGDDYVWPTRKTLATKLGLKKPDGVDRPLKELQDAGLIFTEQRRGDDGAQLASKHKLMLTSNSQTPTLNQGYPYPQSGVGGYPETGVGGTPNQGEAPTPNQGYELEEVELEEVEVKNLSSQALAPLVASDSTPEVQDPNIASDEEFDRALFAVALDEDCLYIAGDEEQMQKMECYDLAWFYDYYRNEEGMRYPGDHLASIALRGGERGVDDWLASQGLCRYEWMTLDNRPACIDEWCANHGMRPDGSLLEEG
jgi:hypothetical protein